jgi:hypothetical protein
LSSSPPLLSFILPPSPIVSTGIIFALTYMCTHFFHRIHPPTSFSHHSLFPSLYQPPLTIGPVLPFCSPVL